MFSINLGVDFNVLLQEENPDRNCPQVSIPFLGPLYACQSCCLDENGSF